MQTKFRIKLLDINIIWAVLFIRYVIKFHYSVEKPQINEFAFLGDSTALTLILNIEAYKADTQGHTKSGLSQL